jgi:precorrin-4 methylase
MRIHTVSDLIARLEDYDPDAPVAIASEPSWPLVNTISEVAEADGTVYLAEGDQTGYLTNTARRAIGW